MAAKWTELQRALIDVDKIEDGFIALYANNKYQITVFEYPLSDEILAVRLNIRARDQGTRHDWRDYQRIKNELCGITCEGVELYPAEARLIDTDNSYNMFVLPPQILFPVGYMERNVSSSSDRKSGRSQRPFWAHHLPNDCPEEGEIWELLKESVLKRAALIAANQQATQELETDGQD